jgi:hypothetical protein
MGLVVALAANAAQRHVTAVTHWGGELTNLTGSFAMNGWLYTIQGACPRVGSGDQGKLFGLDTAVRKTSETPAFMDSIWPDAWPKALDYLQDSRFAPAAPRIDDAHGIVRLLSPQRPRRGYG